MAMGKRKSQRQTALFVATDKLGRSPSHPFIQKLNRLLATAEFDVLLERRCQQYYETEALRDSGGRSDFESHPASVVRQWQAAGLTRASLVD